MQVVQGPSLDCFQQHCPGWCPGVCASSFVAGPGRTLRAREVARQFGPHCCLLSSEPWIQRRNLVAQQLPQLLASFGGHRLCQHLVLQPWPKTWAVCCCEGADQVLGLVACLLSKCAGLASWLAEEQYRGWQHASPLGQLQHQHGFDLLSKQQERHCLASSTLGQELGQPSTLDYLYSANMVGLEAWDLSVERAGTVLRLDP